MTDSDEKMMVLNENTLSKKKTFAFQKRNAKVFIYTKIKYYLNAFNPGK